MPTPSERARADIEAIKERGSNFASIAGHGTVELGAWRDWDDTQRLFALAKFVDWSGVPNEDKRYLIESEVDLSGVPQPTKDDLIPNLIPESEREIRPLTQQLIACCRADAWPGNAAVMDFGINTSSHLGALQYAIREELVTPQELDAAMGNGDKLTEIAQRGDNPYRNVTFSTPWDDMPMDYGWDAPVEDIQALFAEMRADEHAARERDYGTAEAEAYKQRMASAAKEYAEPEPASIDPAALEKAVSGIERESQNPSYSLKDILSSKPKSEEPPSPEPEIKR